MVGIVVCGLCRWRVGCVDWPQRGHFRVGGIEPSTRSTRSGAAGRHHRQNCNECQSSQDADALQAWGRFGTAVSGLDDFGVWQFPVPRRMGLPISSSHKHEPLRLLRRGRTQGADPYSQARAHVSVARRPRTASESLSTGSPGSALPWWPGSDQFHQHRMAPIAGGPGPGGCESHWKRSPDQELASATPVGGEGSKPGRSQIECGDPRPSGPIVLSRPHGPEPQMADSGFISNRSGHSRAVHRARGRPLVPGWDPWPRAARRPPAAGSLTSSRWSCRSCHRRSRSRPAAWRCRTGSSTARPDAPSGRSAGRQMATAGRGRRRYPGPGGIRDRCPRPRSRQWILDVVPLIPRDSVAVSSTPGSVGCIRSAVDKHAQLGRSAGR